METQNPGRDVVPPKRARQMTEAKRHNPSRKDVSPTGTERETQSRKIEKQHPGREAVTPKGTDMETQPGMVQKGSNKVRRRSVVNSASQTPIPI